MLKGLVKSGLVKKSTTKYNKVLAGKSSAYDKWQHAREKEPVVMATAPVMYEQGENGEMVPHKLPDPTVKVIPYGKVWEVQDNEGDDNVVYLFVSPKGKLIKKSGKAKPDAYKLNKMKEERYMPGLFSDVMGYYDRFRNPW